MVYRLNPLEDIRWADLVNSHPSSSIFHSTGWLRTLHCTYGYTPVVFTTSKPQTSLRNGIVFCEIRSWLTGHRLVSLPFSDHCDPLLSDSEEFEELAGQVQAERAACGWQYVELRPGTVTPSPAPGFGTGEQFRLHVLDLRSGIDAVFHKFHKNCIQRKIRRAQREGLVYSEGRSEEILRTFYRLLVNTRRRHHVPAQPFGWFRNLAASLGGALTVRVASHKGRPIAAIVTLLHLDKVVYKYGASDASCHRMGAIPFLLWRTIQEAHAAGCIELDMGRSSLDATGLSMFKERWGAVSSVMTYWRSPYRRVSSRSRHRIFRYASQLFSYAPAGFRAAAGQAFYKHVG
jgi:Acetyltransferase (GNAT) domain